MIPDESKVEVNKLLRQLHKTLWAVQDHGVCSKALHKEVTEALESYEKLVALLAKEGVI